MSGIAKRISTSRLFQIFITLVILIASALVGVETYPEIEKHHQKLLDLLEAQGIVTLGQALALSTAYQGGVVAWVAFWAIYGQGFAGISGIATFGAAYMLVVLIEPLVDLAVLAGAKSLRGLRDSGLVTSRLFA